MIEKYIIRYPFGNIPTKSNEIEIVSDNLSYVELGKNMDGMQTNGDKNYDSIKEKCREISILIKELDELIKQNK